MEKYIPYRYGGRSRAGRAKARPRHAQPSRVIGAVASVLSVALVSLAVWWLWPKDGDEKPEELVRPAPKAVKEVKPQISRSSKPLKPPPEREMTERERFEAAYPKGAFTNGVLRRGYNHTRTPVTNSPYSTERIPLHTAMDQLLAMATSNPGQMTPPLPMDAKLIEKEFLLAIKKPIEIGEDDSPAVRELKERVMRTRAEILELMDKGYTVHQILREHEQISNEHAAIRAQIVTERNRILSEGDHEGAETYLNRMNEELKKLGIQEVGMPGAKGKVLNGRQE